MSQLITTLHVVTAFFVVGPLVIFPMLGMRAMRARDAVQVAAMARMTRIFTLVSVVVAVLGFGALGTADPADQLTLLTPWLAASVVIYVVSASLLMFVASLGMSISAAGIRADPQATRGNGNYRTVAVSSGLASLGLVAIVVLMTWKP